MIMARNILYILLLVIVPASFASGEEPGITYLNEPYHSVALSEDNPSPPDPIELENITDTLSDNIVGHTAVHQVGFQLPHFTGRPGGLLKGRQVVVTFPWEFDVSTVYDVIYRDTDPSRDPEISWIFVYSHSVVVRFKDKLPGPEEPHFAYLSIHTIDNPAVAGSYRVLVKVDNVLRQTIAGPNLSERFWIYSDGDANFDVVVPDEVRAGEQFEMAVINAIDDDGDPFTGVVRVTGGNTAPDGTVPVVPDIYVINGQGVGLFLLSAAGENQFEFRAGEEAKDITVEVLPGAADSLTVILDETQFVGHPFIGEASAVTIYDKYGNLKTDYNETGVDLILSSPTGEISPEILPASSFVDGVTSLNGYAYSGHPGAVELRVTDNNGLQGSVEFLANGVYCVFDERYGLPDWLLTLWYFAVYGTIWNPANLTPVSMDLEAGFVDSDAPEAVVSLDPYCLPLPFEENYCRYKVRQFAEMKPGSYDYIIRITAVYEYGSDSIITEWIYRKEIPVSEFKPFTYEVIDLPSIGYAGGAADTGIVRLLNDNTHDQQISVGPGLFIEKDSIETYVGHQSFMFDWESEKELIIEIRFLDDLVAGSYGYFIQTKARYYPPDRSWQIAYGDKQDLDAEIEIIAAQPRAVQITSVVNEALNSPYVNTGQEFSISGTIVNLSAETLMGPFVLELTSDGQSVTPPPMTLDSIYDNLQIEFPVTAATEPSAVEIFTLRFTEVPDGIQVHPPIDNSAAAVIQIPAKVGFDVLVAGFPGQNVVLSYLQEFDIVGEIVKTGQSQVDGGSLILDYTGPGDFGIEFPSEEQFDPDAVWSLTAPDFDIESFFMVDWGEAPIDRNTGEPAIIGGGSRRIDFAVQGAEARLLIEAGGFDTQPLQRGVPGKLFDLTMQNNTLDNRNIVGLQELEMLLVDRQGNPINAGDLIDIESDTGTNFYLNDIPVGKPDYSQGKLRYTFPGLLITAGQVIKLEYHLTPKDGTDLNYFNIRLNGDLIVAMIVDGPQTGQQVPVSGLLDRSFEVNVPQAIISDDFERSFKNYPNPFNPLVQPTEIRYNLPEDSDVDIYIYTVTGERVRHLHFEAGTNGGQEGVNSGIYWDGHNGKGDMVLNGVYVAYIEAAIGLKATVKLAVVK
jgi:hypothetical protein